MIEPTVVLAAIFLITFVITLLIFVRRVEAGHLPNFRRIPAFEIIKGVTSRAIENGRPLHLSLGLGSMVDQSTADSLAGLSVLNYLAKRAAAANVNPIVSMSDPTVMLFAQNSIRSAHGGDHASTDAAFRNTRWIAPQPAAYAAGVMSLLNADQIEANIMIGDFGDEYLLMGEAAAQQKISHVGGASDPNTLPFIYATAQETLFGEDIYAAGAYLQKRPIDIGSLLAQDTMRWGLVIVMLGGVITASLLGS